MTCRTCKQDSYSCYLGNYVFMTLEIDGTWLKNSPWGYKLRYGYVISRQFLQVVYFLTPFFKISMYL